jgi:hypothetical protein
MYEHLHELSKQDRNLVFKDLKFLGAGHHYYFPKLKSLVEPLPLLEVPPFCFGHVRAYRINLNRISHPARVTDCYSPL